MRFLVYLTRTFPSIFLSLSLSSRFVFLLIPPFLQPHSLSPGRAPARRSTLSSRPPAQRSSLTRGKTGRGRERKGEPWIRELHRLIARVLKSVRERESITREERGMPSTAECFLSFSFSLFSFRFPSIGKRNVIFVLISVPSRVLAHPLVTVISSLGLLIFSLSSVFITRLPRRHDLTSLYLSFFLFSISLSFSPPPFFLSRLLLSVELSSFTVTVVVLFCPTLVSTSLFSYYISFSLFLFPPFSILLLFFLIGTVVID